MNKRKETVHISTPRVAGQGRDVIIGWLVSGKPQIAICTILILTHVQRGDVRACDVTERMEI